MKLWAFDHIVCWMCEMDLKQLIYTVDIDTQLPADSREIQDGDWRVAVSLEAACPTLSANTFPQFPIKATESEHWQQVWETQF